MAPTDNRFRPEVGHLRWGVGRQGAHASSLSLARSHTLRFARRPSLLAKFCRSLYLKASRASGEGVAIALGCAATMTEASPQGSKALSKVGASANVNPAAAYSLN